MQHSTHPADERLAAYASADREAVFDRELASHIGSCDRCGPIVDELTILRDALSLLPDVAPSRPLRLIPPVAAPDARPSGAFEWLRRLTAPAMAAGFGLVLVGAVGASGLVGGIGGATADLAAGQSAKGAEAPGVGGAYSPVPVPVTSDTDYGTRSGPPRSEGSGSSMTPTPSPNPDHATDQGSKEQPWLALLIAGFGLFGISAILRYSLAPRAG